jgi:hypothetical protein
MTKILIVKFKKNVNLFLFGFRPNCLCYWPFQGTASPDIVIYLGPMRLKSVHSLGALVVVSFLYIYFCSSRDI